jgi:hypothetical protein
MATMTRLPADLRNALYNFLNEAGGYAWDDGSYSFDLTAFLAEALLSADDNDHASERAGHYDFPGLACMFERLDEHLDYHRTASEVRQAKGGAVLEWFDAP